MLNGQHKYNLFFILCCVPCCLGICNYEGQNYAEGTSWNSSCNICNCHSDVVSCTRITCPAIICKPGEVITHPIDECCPECNPVKKPCIVGSANYLHNDVWSYGSKCMLYQCQDGLSVPFIIQCPAIACNQGESLFTPPGECCPVCTENCDEEKKAERNGSLTMCSKNISITQDCDNDSHLKHNLSWKNPCAFCVTENSHISCYNKKCDACPSHVIENDICCNCSSAACAKNCLKCLDNDTNVCTHCKDLTKVIHHGECLKECPKGFFKDEDMTCKSCPLHCQTCFGNMTSQCSSCNSGYFLQKGHCVKTCDLNFYESNGYCLECHKTCSSCVGPSDEECITCALSGQLILDGKCVDDCDGHYYISDGYCLSCNETCVRCLKNGSCQYCEKGFYLEDGLCLLECSPGYYAFMNAYCLPCHEECQSCFGPLAYQCTSCPFNQYLLQNSCVHDCGQGYFGDLGAGVCRSCHPKCRACLGGASDDKCLSCTSGYLLPYIGTHFGSCVQKCPDQYYLEESGICGSCYETCQTCFGPNETECLSCNNTLLFKNGACIPHCSAGYFDDGGVCYACHPSCATCSGFSENDCYTCPPGRKLKFGKCISVCKEGKYMNTDGLCVDCHPSCSDCMLGSGENQTVQCIKCKNQQHNIFKDECILECASDYYLNSYHICTECHPTCATCERTGATSCASCWDGYVLTHLGTCEHQCHQGYFSSGGFCEACSADCHECISTAECLKCKGDLVLQFGKCISNCSGHHYLDTVSRQCKECSSECETCRGPESYECTSCYPGMLFEDGVCVHHCSAEFFQDGNICKTCDLKCQTCSSLELCTSCKLSYFLLKNECVDDCGAGYFADFETQICKGCSSGCLSCISEEYCALCFDGFYLSNFKCVTQCPLEHYADSSRRLCIRNTDVPSLYTNSILKMQSGRKALISASLLSAYDSDSDFLLITVSNLPRNGYLVKMSEMGHEINLKTGENFTSTHLKDGWIFFKHIKGIPLDGNVSLRINDGQFMGNEVSLPVLVSSEFPPFVEQIKNIILTEDSSVVLDSSYFFISDPDNIQDVTLHIVEGPCSGKLVLLPNETEVQTLSYEEFLQHKLVLKALKSPLKHDDKFIIQVSDGFNTAIAEIKIFILPKQQKHLFILRNYPLLVKLDEITKLTRNYLLAVGEDIHPNEITFSIENSAVTPYGYFFKAINNSKKKKKILSAKINFSQEDIDEELIYYKHFNNATSNITIPIKASITKFKTELSFDFEVRVLKYDTVSFDEETNQFGMMVLQNHPATITNDHLPMQFNGMPSEDIVYMITRKLTKEEGFLESLDKPGYRLQSFTQKDIDNMKVVYHPPPYLEATETNYIFQFIVLDAKRRIQLSPVQNFTITVRPQSTEFTSPSTSIDHEVTIVVSQGQSVELGSHWLSTVGHQIPDDQLEVVLNIAPQHGNLTQLQNGYDIKIEEEDGYSFIAIIHDTYYTHDGSNKLKDFAVFKIMGGPYTSLNKINFMIAPNDKESPVILDSTSLMGSVTEGKYIDLKRHHLAYTDLVSGDHDILYTLLDEPKYGKLSKLVGGNYITLKISDTFTQQDINDQQIRYTANDGIGNSIVKDFLSFDVSDGSGNIQPNQALTMKVKPKIREPPTVKVISDVKVNESGEAIIEPNIMTVFDPDSPLSDLTVFIEKQPDFGFLENSREVVGAEKSIAGIPISKFSYVDLVEGYIKYIQITHRDVEPEKDTMYIRISDGYTSSPAHLVNITIKPINDETPLVFTQNLSVLQGSFVKILNSSLSISDEDTSFDQLIIHLDNPPQQGEIRLLSSNNYNLKDSKPVLKQDTVTYQDVLDGLIMYVHEDSKSPENDTFSFTVSDGQHFASGSIDIHIIVRDREVPYLVKNIGLELLPGESSVIDNKTLSALDSDSSVQLLRYILTSDPTSGELHMYQNGNAVKVSSEDGKLNSFTQEDIDNGKLFYRHNVGDPIGLHHFKFNIHDTANNTLIDQKFFISIFEDLFPPLIIHNTGLEVEEKRHACINSSMLSAVDDHQKNKDLIFSLMSLPAYGYLVLKNDTEKPITSFFMSDLKAEFVCYIHKSDRYSLKDGFIFSVSDGKNYVLQPFYISIKHLSNKMPFVKIYPLSLEEGAQKIISEFEIDVLDYDSTDSQLIISVISPPIHGNIVNSSGISLTQFSFEDVKLSHVIYVHDDTDTTEDNFTFVLTDGSNVEFVLDMHGKNTTTKDPVVFPIKILSLDDSFPVLVRNEALQTLKKDSDKVWGIISENNLYTEDIDTKKENILYHITIQPRFGSLQLTNRPNSKIYNFSQENIENKELLYILGDDDFATTEDSFMFTIEDTKPNKIFRNIFSIYWSRISFVTSLYNMSETSGLLEIPVKRTGNKKLDFIASCKIKSTDPQKSSKSVIAVVDEIHFRVNDEVKFCIFRILDNNLFERNKEFQLFLESNVSLLASPFVAVVAISDPEDEPTISFKESMFKINETDGYFNFTVIRKGDLNQELSVLCNTSDVTAQGSLGSSLQTGSDYRSRDSSHQNFITFKSGISEAICSVKVIDDNLYEEEEEFLLQLSKPHPVGKIENHTAHIIIQGPNDVPVVYLQDNDYEIYIGEQNSSVVISRQGVDLSTTCTVWCGSNFLSSGTNEKHLNSYYQITFQPFETSSKCLVPTNAVEQETSDFGMSLTIFIDSSKGCYIDERNKIIVPLKKKIVYPIVEFRTESITVPENVGSLNISVLRSGNISSTITLHCYTQDGTAVAREDYEGRYKKQKNSLLHFNPEQKEAFCALKIFDDGKYEGNETFHVLLSSLEQGSEIVTLGMKKAVTVNINDTEDITVIELEKSHYLFSQSSFPNSSSSAVIAVLRHGDTSLLSKVRISTIDGSASSGLDYYAKSKLLSFLPGEKKKNFEIELLYNKRRNWALSFTVILGPDEVMNAEIGTRSKALVTIPRVMSTESLILPSVPIVISLIDYDDVSKGLHQDAKSGYPLVCITPCDINYPDYAVTSALCKESGINISSVNYSWEIAMPLNSEVNLSPFERITESTLFTSAYGKILDSIYFRPQERVRCIAQPVDNKGHLGIALRSKPIKISSESGFCLTPSKLQFPTMSLSSQPFIATLNYINSSDTHHPNKLHIHIEVPHEDGLMPLISTYPMHNIEFLLVQNIYRQQHICSNLLQDTEKGFLKNLQPQLNDIKSAFPYHGEIITKDMQLLYQHLDLKKCKWSFDAWYSMSELTELCGGSVISDFKARDIDKSYISVLLPLYVTYIFAAAPTGWTSVEHRTEIEFSFYYDTFLWKEGYHVDNSLNASISIVHIGTDSSGHLFFEFKTVAKFYGCFVLEHHTVPGIKSHVTVPGGLNVKFDLDLLWSEQTFDGPIQFWKATSNYNLKDYSGHYIVHLIPCEVSSSKQFPVGIRMQFIPCVAKTPQRFELPIAFQQTLRPEPVTYALETYFQLFKDKSLFLLNPFENYLNLQHVEYKGAFSRGDNVYGRVFWSPEQELESAYNLKINEVILCSGRNGFLPLYDPTGKIYGKGPQYGCLIPNKNLRHKFTLLNRYNPGAINEDFEGMAFKAEFIENSLEYNELAETGGVDGFVFNTDPLYQINSNQQWFLQVTYSIKPKQTSRVHRSLESTEISSNENLSNIKMLLLKVDEKSHSYLQAKEELGSHPGFGAHHVMYVISALLIILGIFIIGYRNPKLTQYTYTKVLDKYYIWTNLNAKSFSRDVKMYKTVNYSNKKLKTSEKCKVKVYTPNSKVSYITDNSSETEV